MEIIYSHKLGKERGISRIDHFLKKLTKDQLLGEVEIRDPKKEWIDNIMYFEFIAVRGAFRIKLSGTIEVNDSQINLELNLPFLASVLATEEEIVEEINKQLDELFQNS